MPHELGLLAGRQTRAHLALSRALWLRQRGKTYSFQFDPASQPGLSIALESLPVTSRGETGRLRVGDDEGLIFYVAADHDEGLIFYVAADPGAFLARLATWAKQAIADVPALGILADAGAAQVADLAAPIEAASLDIFYQSALWDDLLVPDEATIASALQAATPGERLWFWLTAEPGDYAVPLIVQPLAWDINRDRMAWLMDRNAELGAGEGVSGTCSLADDGRFQFLGDDLHASLLEPLANWVGAYAQDYPPFARLADCRLLRTEAGTVAEIYAAPKLWAGLAPRPVTGSIAETAATLASLPEGGECWFWITGGAGAPFLQLWPSDDDPQGEAFRAALPNLYVRFPQSHADAISGVMTRLAGGNDVFVSAEGSAESFARQIGLLLTQYGDRFAALRPLARTPLLRPGEVAPAIPAATDAM